MNIWKGVLIFLALSAASAWLGVLSYGGNNLNIVVCDVGQGDAILIQQASVQILIDGGPNTKVTECLEQNVPYWDRSIELVVITHPQKDHFGGLIDVFRAYSVKNVLTSGLIVSSIEYGVLESMVGGSGARVLHAPDVNDIRLGLIYLEVVHPSNKYVSSNSNAISAVENNKLGYFESGEDPNLYSVVVLLSYKNFQALFTGDINPDISDDISDDLISDKYIEYIKVPHHGSKNGLSEKLLKTLNPKVAVISSGEGNSFGHPHKQILNMLEDAGVSVLRTDKGGTIKIGTNGEDYWMY